MISNLLFRPSVVTAIGNYHRLFEAGEELPSSPTIETLAPQFTVLPGSGALYRKTDEGFLAKISRLGRWVLRSTAVTEKWPRSAFEITVQNTTSAIIQALGSIQSYNLRLETYVRSFASLSQSNPSYDMQKIEASSAAELMILLRALCKAHIEHEPLEQERKSVEREIKSMLDFLSKFVNMQDSSFKLYVPRLQSDIPLLEDSLSPEGEAAVTGLLKARAYRSFLKMEEMAKAPLPLASLFRVISRTNTEGKETNLEQEEEIIFRQFFSNVMKSTESKINVEEFYGALWTLIQLFGGADTFIRHLSMAFVAAKLETIPLVQELFQQVSSKRALMLGSFIKGSRVFTSRGEVVLGDRLLSLEKDGNQEIVFEASLKHQSVVVKFSKQNSVQSALWAMRALRFQASKNVQDGNVAKFLDFLPDIGASLFERLGDRVDAMLLPNTQDPVNPVWETEEGKQLFGQLRYRGLDPQFTDFLNAWLLGVKDLQTIKRLLAFTKFLKEMQRAGKCYHDMKPEDFRFDADGDVRLTKPLTIRPYFWLNVANFIESCTKGNDLAYLFFMAQSNCIAVHIDKGDSVELEEGSGPNELYLFLQGKFQRPLAQENVEYDFRTSFNHNGALEDAYEQIYKEFNGFVNALLADCRRLYQLSKEGEEREVRNSLIDQVLWHAKHCFSLTRPPSLFSEKIVQLVAQSQHLIKR